MLVRVYINPYASFEMTKWKMCCYVLRLIILCDTLRWNMIFLFLFLFFLYFLNLNKSQLRIFSLPTLAIQVSTQWNIFDIFPHLHGIIDPRWMCICMISHDWKANMAWLFVMESKQMASHWGWKQTRNDKPAIEDKQCILYRDWLQLKSSGWLMENHGIAFGS